MVLVRWYDQYADQLVFTATLLDAHNIHVKDVILYNIHVNVKNIRA